MALGIGTIGAGIYGLGKTIGIDNIFDGIGSIFGGDGCSKQDRQKESEIKQAIQTYLSPGDMRNLVSGMESDVAPTASEMAKFFVGGADCKHKNVSSGDQRFLDRLPQKIQQRAREAQQNSGSSDWGLNGSMGGNSSGGGSLPSMSFLGNGSNALLFIGGVGAIVGLIAYLRG